jgi:hypothetical protein
MTEIDKDAVKNPSSGLYGRNPTHILEANDAEDQSDIVKSIKGSGAKRMRVLYEYKDADMSSPPPLAGILKMREMSEQDAVAFCKNMMRTRPNIFKAHIKLGNYPTSLRIDNRRTRLLNSRKPRFHTEIGEKIGALLADKTVLVTEIKYVVHNADPGYFNATAEVYGVRTMEEYLDEKSFNPSIEFDFVKTT